MPHYPRNERAQPGVLLHLDVKKLGRIPRVGHRITGQRTDTHRDAGWEYVHVAMDELRAHGLFDQTSQAFAVFLPVRSVAVMDDGRRYDYVIALRAVETVDLMTGRWARLSYEFLDVCARRHFSTRWLTPESGYFTLA